MSRMIIVAYPAGLPWPFDRCGAAVTLSLRAMADAFEHTHRRKP
jgi:hypothetical protein